MVDALLRSINLRDLGGIRVGNGMIRNGRVFRSAALADLSQTDRLSVSALGIHTIVDLRRNAERLAFPTPWRALGCAGYWAREHAQSNADHLARMRSPEVTASDSRLALQALYADLPFDQADAYRHLLQLVAAGEGPVLFHCAVGKDRTGVAAALILAAVGVGREAIVADYLETEHFDMLASPTARSWPARSEQRAAALAPLLGVDRVYLDAMFEAIRRRHGSVATYLRDVLGLTSTLRLELQHALIDPAAAET